ncbi:MAG: RlmE family RNA methyltransferase [Alphaproteobacteria bacterium]|nr:RlmE family RNA methyltransferase [Alphaproteobacteria bacterium]
MTERRPGKGRDREQLRDGKVRTTSSRRWLQRQLNDPYVIEARRAGFRSRAAFKLAEIDDKLKLLRPGMRVVDLGAAPGGWSQIAAQRVAAREGRGRVVAIDLLEIDPIPGVDLMVGDFMDDAVLAALVERVGESVDVVLSDMAPSASGQPDIDHLRILNLAEAGLAFAEAHLKPGGSFVTKMLQGSGEREFIAALRRGFAEVGRIKPPSSRRESAEFFLVARSRR